MQLLRQTQTNCNTLTIWALNVWAKKSLKWTIINLEDENLQLFSCLLCRINLNDNSEILHEVESHEWELQNWIAITGGEPVHYTQVKIRESNHRIEFCMVIK